MAMLVFNIAMSRYRPELRRRRDPPRRRLRQPVRLRHHGGDRPDQRHGLSHARPARSSAACLDSTMGRARRGSREGRPARRYFALTAAGATALQAALARYKTLRPIRHRIRDQLEPSSPDAARDAARRCMGAPAMRLAPLVPPTGGRPGRAVARRSLALLRSGCSAQRLHPIAIRVRLFRRASAALPHALVLRVPDWSPT